MFITQVDQDDWSQYLKYAPEQEILGFILRPWEPMKVTIMMRDGKRNYGQIMDGMPFF
jgi:hypothetical protein